MTEKSGDGTVHGLQSGNRAYAAKFADEFRKHALGQKPRIAVLSCSDSRVVPELIFDKSIGDLFVVRVAGNVAVDSSVITSLEYAVEKLGTGMIVIMGHTGCGAVAAAEHIGSGDGPLIAEIRECFSMNADHVAANVMRQVKMLAERSAVIQQALRDGKLKILGAVYQIDSGSVSFLKI